jgi:gamma-glutamyltranspeptidase/glutathione hydrolase
MALRGIVTAPHHLAAQSGLAILREGGNAIEAAIAACATCAVAYPHMNGLGGDGFWLIHEPGKSPVCIDGSGAAGSDASLAAYRARGLKQMPDAGPLAAATVAGIVSSWQAALELSQRWEGRLPLSRLFGEAVHHAGHGVAVTEGVARALADRQAALIKQPGFAASYGQWDRPGKVMRQPGTVALLESLARTGLDDFYRGGVAQYLAEEMKKLGCPISSTDLARHRSVRRRPLSVAAGGASVYTTPPPTQGLATLIILGLFERIKRKAGFGVEAVHALVEAAKLAYEVRDRHITDPAHMAVHATTYVADPVLDRMAREISPKTARPWGGWAKDGDTVWLGVIDAQGRAVSVIQSLRQAWGSGVVVGDFQLIWHNRAIGFSLDEIRANPLTPGRKPLHTLAPALARFKDGRIMPFGTMGGDGQPQTLSALFSRYALYGQTLQQAVSEPRWRLGPSPHNSTGKLLLEDRFGADMEVGLARLGHSVEMAAAFDSRMGHAGALVRHDNGLLEGAFDPRSDGAVAAF